MPCGVGQHEQRRSLGVRAREPFIGSEGAAPRGGLCRGALSERADPRGVSLKGPCPEWEDPRGPHQGWRTEGAFPREPVRESRADGAALRGPRRWGLSERADLRGPLRGGHSEGTALRGAVRWDLSRGADPRGVTDPRLPIQVGRSRGADPIRSKVADRTGLVQGGEVVVWGGGSEGGISECAEALDADMWGPFRGGLDGRADSRRADTWGPRQWGPARAGSICGSEPIATWKQIELQWHGIR